VVETKGPTGPPHAPPPSLWPLGFAIGLTVALVGLVIGSWSTVAVGSVVLVAFGFVWLRDLATGVAPPAEPVYDEPAVAVGTAESPAEGEAALAPMDDEEIARYPRSKFLEGATLGLGGVITGLVAVPVAGFAIAPAFIGQEDEDVNLGPIDQFPEGEFTIATFLAKPEEGEVSRRTAYIRNNGMKDGVPSFTILSNRCVHLGCPVQVNGLPLDEEKQTITANEHPVDLTPTQAASGFGCPCHGGQYDTEGNRTAGPPVRALDRYAFKIVDGNLVLTKPYSVAQVDGQAADAKIERYAIADPSIHVDGPEALLYPFPTGR
jgi:menaquinol-cytochrome c reductase iron-sulfur subunit